MSEDEQDSKGEDTQMGFFGLELGDEDDAGSNPVKRWRLLMEREWSRREVCIEQSFWNYFYNPVFCGEPPLSDHNTPVNSPLLIGFDVLVPFLLMSLLDTDMSEPDGERVRLSTEKVQKWQESLVATSGYGTTSNCSVTVEEEN